MCLSLSFDRSLRTWLSVKAISPGPYRKGIALIGEGGPGNHITVLQDDRAGAVCPVLAGCGSLKASGNGLFIGDDQRPTGQGGERR